MSPETVGIVTALLAAFSGVLIAVFTSRAATRANRDTLDAAEALEAKRVDATAYERASAIYENSLQQLERQIDRLQRQIDQLEAEAIRHEVEAQDLRQKIRTLGGSA